MIDVPSAIRRWLPWLILAALLASPSARGDTLLGKVVEVVRGDIVVVEDGAKSRHTVRLAGIDAPDLKQAFGKESRRGLADLLQDRRIAVERRKQDNYGRIVGRVLVAPAGCATCPPTRDAALAQLEAGLAWWFRDERREQSLEEQGYYEYAEFDARTRRLGLWRDAAPVPPWQWRKRENKPYLTRLPCTTAAA
ncbi:MAG: thermonuclease family protein [Rhodocyclales bacterium]|nr:thermonuclease family protein [Rhodocyclales bacterium]